MNVPVRRLTVCCSLMIWAFVSASRAVAEETSSSQALAKVLATWESASHDRQGPSVATLQKTYGKSHSGHEFVVASRLLGPVDALTITKQYLLELPRANVIAAVPKDLTDRLFFSKVELVFHEDGSLSKLQFFDPSGKQRPVSIQAAGTVSVVRRIPSPPKESRPARPVQLVTFLEPADSAAEQSAGMELSHILKQWSAAGQAVETLHVEFYRYVYDATEKTETRGQGTFVFEAPFRGLYTVRGFRVPPGAKSSRKDAQGKPFLLKSAKPVTLYWTSGQLARIDMRKKEYELFTIPNAFLGDSDITPVGSWDLLWTTLASPRRLLPGYIETDPKQLQSRFDWSILSQDKKQIVLVGRTLSVTERRQYSAVHVVLDPRSYRTLATKLIDPAGTRETVHVFRPPRINEPRRLDEPSWEPQLQQFQLLTAPPLAPPVTNAEEEESSVK